MYKFLYQFYLFVMAYNAKNKGTKKEVRETELQEFRISFANARKKFMLEELEQITGIKAANLSAYGSGKKNPSTTTIENFNTKLKQYMSKSTNPRKNAKKGGRTNQVEEERQPYIPKDKQSEDRSDKLFQALTATNNLILTENERNAKRFDRILDTHATLMDNNKVLAYSTEKLADANATLAATNAQLATRVLLISIPGTSPQP